MREVTRGMSVVGGPGVEEVSMARDARDLCNELLFWANDYFARFPPDSAAVDADARRWAERVLSRELDLLLEQALARDYPHPVWRDLVEAVFRCRYLLSHPENQSARAAGADAIKAAVHQANAWMEERDIARLLSVPRHAPAF